MHSSCHNNKSEPKKEIPDIGQGACPNFLEINYKKASNLLLPLVKGFSLIARDPSSKYMRIWGNEYSEIQVYFGLMILKTNRKTNG